MRSVMVDSSGAVSVETRPDPELPGANGAIVKVEAAAICGSDLHFLEGHYPIFEPVSLGHEAIGTVVETGSEVAGFSMGDRVLGSSVAGCGRCAGCATHDPIRCACLILARSLKSAKSFARSAAVAIGGLTVRAAR